MEPRPVFEGQNAAYAAILTVSGVPAGRSEMIFGAEGRSEAVFAGGGAVFEGSGGALVGSSSALCETKPISSFFLCFWAFRSSV